MRTKTPTSRPKAATTPKAGAKKKAPPKPAAAKGPARPAAGRREGSATAIAAGARLLWVEPGLHSLVVAPASAARGTVAGMSLPAIHVSTPSSHGAAPVELVATRRAGNWIGAEGGAVVLRAPASGGPVLVTSYAPAGQPAVAPNVELRPVDVRGAATPAPAGQAIPTEIVLHIEREGDRQFTAAGWAGRLGSRLRVEALAVRPLETISPGEIEYKAYTTGGRETPWVSDGRLCGTRGQGLPLTGFAIRLAPHLRNGFDVIYRGAYVASGPAPAARNGEPCFASLRDDPLEAIEVRIVERGAEA